MVKLRCTPKCKQTGARAKPLLAVAVAVSIPQVTIKSTGPAMNVSEELERFKSGDYDDANRLIMQVLDVALRQVRDITRGEEGEPAHGLCFVVQAFTCASCLVNARLLVTVCHVADAACCCFPCCRPPPATPRTA